MSDLLDPSALLNSLPNKLPQPFKTLASPQDALAALVHAVLSSLGFRLIAIDDSSSSQSYPDNILPENWNARGPGDYTFRYRHEQSSLEFIVKVSKLGPRTVVNAIATENDKIASLDISTADFSSPSFFPYDAVAGADRPLVHGFISSNRVADFVSQLKLKIISKLVPGLRKEGYTEVADDSSTNASSGSRPRPEPVPLFQPRRPEGPPEQPPIRSDSHIVPDNPLSIGRRDLDPLASQIQPNPFAPPSLFPSNPDDGMYVGPHHPIFGSRDGTGGDGNAPQGPWGGDGFLPPLGAPPGARFDPVGPGPFGGRNPFGGPSGRGPRAPGRQPHASGDPDNDEFMPPGSRDMFS